MLTHHNPNAKIPARVVILGANGFVGRALAAHLLERGVPTLAVGRDRIDLTADDAANKLAAELRTDDAVAFLSALTPDKGRGIPTFQANIQMAAAVCAALERVTPAHVVYVSSDAVYPFRTGQISEESSAEPTDLYGAMHLTRELMVRQATKAPVAVLRPTLIYGAADTHNSYGPNRLRRTAKKDGRITLFGAGEETRDHVYIDDVVTLVDLALVHRSEGTLNLATGRSISYADLAAKIKVLSAAPVEIVTTPRQNPITHRAFDVTALHQAFPAFRFTSIDEGLATANRDEL